MLSQETNDKQQWQKIKDIEYAGFIAIGLASTSEAIENSFGLPLIIFGLFWIIVGLIQARSWKTYYEHRVQLVKWITILLLALIVVQFGLFYKSPEPFINKVIILIVNIVLDLVLIAFFNIKKSKLMSND